MSLSSTTARPPCTTENTSIDVNTTQPGTPVKTPCSVVINPNTIQGWRPISVKIHPTSEATMGIGADHTATFHTQSGSWVDLRVTQRPTAVIKADSAPRPIIQRNDQ